jgi:penicillin-binding protein 1A
MATALKGSPDVPFNVPEGIMQVKIDAYTGTQVYEDEEGVYEYFYQENPPPATYVELTPLEELPDAYNSDSGFPDSMTDNPLQSQPPSLPEQPQNHTPTERPAAEQVPRQANPAPKNKGVDSSDSTARILNPSGF